MASPVPTEPVRALGDADIGTPMRRRRSARSAESASRMTGRGRQKGQAKGAKGKGGGKGGHPKGQGKGASEWPRLALNDTPLDVVDLELDRLVGCIIRSEASIHERLRASLEAPECWSALL